MQLSDIFNKVIKKHEEIKDNSSDSIEEVLKFLKVLLDEYYKNNNRHEYNQIASYLYTIHRNDKINDGKLEIITYIFAELYEKYKNSINEPYKENYIKLYDHIILETQRLEYFANFTETSKIKEKIDNLNSIVNNTLENIKNLTMKQYKDYITILGIFAAIFMAFDSGLKIELEILNQVNDYAKGVLIIFIALFTYILLKSFYRFIVYIYNNNHDKFSVKQHTWKYCVKALTKPLNITLVALAALYCILIGLIDKQYEQKIKPIVKEEISKLQQKEEKGNIIIYNNTSSTQNQDSTIIPKDEHIQQPMKIKANPPKQNTKKQSDNIKQACPPCQN